MPNLLSPIIDVDITHSIDDSLFNISNTLGDLQISSINRAIKLTVCDNKPKRIAYSRYEKKWLIDNPM